MAARRPRLATAWAAGLVIRDVHAHGAAADHGPGRLRPGRARRIRRLHGPCRASRPSAPATAPTTARAATAAPAKNYSSAPPRAASATSRTASRTVPRLHAVRPVLPRQSMRAKECKIPLCGYRGALKDAGIKNLDKTCDNVLACCAAQPTAGGPQALLRRHQPDQAGRRRQRRPRLRAAVPDLRRSAKSALRASKGRASAES